MDLDRETFYPINL